MTIHSSILARRTPWTEEPGRLQFIGSQRYMTELSLIMVAGRFLHGGGNIHESRIMLISEERNGA